MVCNQRRSNRRSTWTRNFFLTFLLGTTFFDIAFFDSALFGSAMAAEQDSPESIHGELTAQEADIGETPSDVEKEQAKETVIEGTSSRTARVPIMVPPNLQPAPDLSVCRLPAMTIEALDPATQRAVIRQGPQPLRVVKVGSRFADVATIRQIGRDKLVAEIDRGDGPRPLVWFFAPEAAGQQSQMQCFVEAPPPGAAPRSPTSDPAPVH